MSARRRIVCRARQSVRVPCTEAAGDGSRGSAAYGVAPGRREKGARQLAPGHVTQRAKEFK